MAGQLPAAGFMKNRIEKIKYLCKRYWISAALASETLSQLDPSGKLTIEQLANECDRNEEAYQENKSYLK